jgi:hypothetical protein
VKGATVAYPPSLALPHGRLCGGMYRTDSAVWGVWLTVDASHVGCGCDFRTHRLDTLLCIPPSFLPLLLRHTSLCDGTFVLPHDFMSRLEPPTGGLALHVRTHHSTNLAHLLSSVGWFPPHRLASGIHSNTVTGVEVDSARIACTIWDQRNCTETGLCSTQHSS